MKKLLLMLLFPALTFAQNKAANHLWEAAAFGEIPGITSVRLAGMNSGITTTFEPAWGESAAYAPGIVALVSPICASSNANDTSAGTGARTISVTGLNTSFARFTETVTLNGTTVVAMATANILFIDKITVATAGSGGLNAGIVQCGVGDAGAGDLTTTHQYLGVSSATAIAAAGAGMGNVSESFMYGVASGKTLICRDIEASSVFATAASAMEVAVDGYTNLGILKRFYHGAVHTNGGMPNSHKGLVVFPEKTLIVGKLAGATGTLVGPAWLTADCLLIDNTWEDTAQDIF